MRTLVILAALAIALPAPAAPDTAPLETIIVTGSRTPLARDRLPASVSVIDRAQIEARQASYVADLLRHVPGVAVSRAGGFGTFTQVRMRGAEGNQVMVLVDGIEANDPANGDELDLGSFSTANVERIEVVRGPQSALWGSDALAGVINIITRKGEAGWRSEIELEGGSFASNRQSASMSMVRDRGRLRAAFTRIDTGGTNVARFGDEDDAFHGRTLDLSGALRPREELELSFVLRSDDSTTQTDSGALTGIPVDTPGTADNDRSYLGTRAALALFEGHWLQRLEGNWTSNENDNVDPAVFQQSETAADRYELTYQSTVLFDWPALLDSAHRATFAVDVEHQAFRQRGPVTIFGDPNQDRSLDNTGWVGEYHVDFGDHVTLGGSVRHDDNSDFADATTWRASALWRIAPTASVLSVTYATGQKAPTFTERFGFASGGLFGPVFIGNAGLKPERARGWEVGLSQPFAGGRVRLDATWFSERLRDEINGFVTDATGTTATARNLDGTSRRQGVELALAAEPGWGLSTHATFTYLDATEIDRASGRRVDEARRPNHLASLALDWTGFDRRLRLSGFATYSGTFEDVVFLAPLFQQQRVSMDTYTVVGMSARWRVNRVLEVFGRAENLLDAHYEEVFGFRTPGLGGHLGLRFSFAPE